MLILSFTDVPLVWLPVLESDHQEGFYFACLTWLGCQLVWFNGPLAREFTERFNASDSRPCKGRVDAWRQN